MQIPKTLPETPEEAQDLAIEWSYWQGVRSLSYSELSKWQDFFETVAEKFPELHDEFTENAII